MTDLIQRGLQAGHYHPSPLSRFLANRRGVPVFLNASPSALLPQQVIVPDVYFYQDINATPQGIDFQRMALNGAAGVIIRAGQGAWIDEDFVRNWNNAKAASLPRGSYWFYDPRVKATEQADRFATLFGDDLPELDLWLDAEYTWGGAWAGWSHLYDFLERLRLRLPSVQITIYTGYYWWFDNVIRYTTPAQLAYFGRYTLDIAWYTDNPALVRIPPPWTSARWHQFTDRGPGLEYGVESLGIDLNRFLGTPEEYRDTFNLGGTEPPEGVVMKGTVLVTANIRDGSTANLVIGQVYRDDVMYGDVRLFNGLQRLFYTKVYRAEGNVQEWPDGSNTAVSDGTTQILQLSNEPEPAPDVHIDMTLKSDGTITGTWNDI